MAYGDVGGAVTELIITCVADLDMAKGDAVALVGDYRVQNHTGHRIFGQALADADEGDAVPVKVRGICIFRYAKNTAYPPVVDGFQGCVADLDSPGEVMAWDESPNTNLKVDHDSREVHVLL